WWLLEHLVLGRRSVAELVRDVVVARALERDGDLLVTGIFPVPTVNARKRSGQRAGLTGARALLVALRVPRWRAVGLGVELVIHRSGGRPRVQERFALVEPV